MLKLWRRASRYVRYDLREIIVPSSLPNPPDEQIAPPRTWKECWQLVKLGCSDYRDSWRFHSPEKLHEDDQDPVHTEQQSKLKEDLAFVARGSAEHIKPYLQRVYAIRAATLQAAGQQFVDGYKEGVEKAKADAIIDTLAESFWDKSRKVRSNGDQKMDSGSHADPKSHDNETSPAQNSCARPKSKTVQQRIRKQDSPS